ncbi:MAG TPA: hypothetical protein VN207_03160 [Ktedonobacteraceae bacterium]|nr:hypothetical protein [Ktedonobacteraceae bacterium]
MLERLDLNEVAEAYFSVRTPDRPEYERLLIRAGAEAIFPLLDALLIVTSEYKNQIVTLIRRERLSTKEADAVRIFLAKAYMEPMIEAAYDVVRRIGPLAQVLLCGMLLHYEYKIRIAAAVLLTMNNSPDEKVQKLVPLSIALLQQKYRNQGILVRVLGIVLFHTEASEWKKIVEDEARSKDVTVDEWMKQIMNTALAELVR